MAKTAAKPSPRKARALERAIETLVDITTSQHTWDTSIGRDYRLVIKAARAHLETLRSTA